MMVGPHVMIYHCMYVCIHVCMYCMYACAISTGISALSSMGYAAVDIVSTVFRVVKNYDMAEYQKLEYIKVHSAPYAMYYYY